MNIYVAGKTHDLTIVREVQQWLIDEGHQLTHDWTVAVDKHGADHEGEPMSREDAEMIALEDINGVKRADLMIVIPNPKWCGSLIEIGAALATNTPVLILGTPHQRCVFWAHPLVRQTGYEWWGLNRSDLAHILWNLKRGSFSFPATTVRVSGRQ